MKLHWSQRWRRDPTNFDANGRLTRRGFVRAALYFIANDILIRGAPLVFMLAAITLAIWSMLWIAERIITLCIAF